MTSPLDKVHLIRFASEAAAQADAVVGAYWQSDDQGGGSWDGARCIPGTKAWQPANDTTQSTVGPNGETITQTSHAYEADARGNVYWYIAILSDAIEPSLRDHPTCMLVLDGAKSNAGDPDFVVYSPLTTAQLDGFMVEPTPLGIRCPFGRVAT